MTNLKQNGFESNPKNSLKNSNIQNIQFILNDEIVEVDEEIVCEYGENISELVEKLKDDVLDLFSFRIACVINSAYPTIIKNGQINMNEIEDYINNNYDYLRNQLVDIVWDDLLES
jgi:hypothetical protein